MIPLMEVDLSELGHAVLAEAVRAYREALGERLMAAYGLGSLAHGGFSPLVSDVDLCIVLTDPLHVDDEEMIGRVAETVKARGTPLHSRLSVFWGSPSTLRGQHGGGRLPPLDLLDLIEHGLLLAGDDVRRDLPRPSRIDLLVAGAEFALDFLAGVGPRDDLAGQTLGSMRPATEDAVEQVRRPEVLLALGVRQVTKTVLFPVRFLYTATTGLVGTNESAAQHYIAGRQAPSAELVGAALAWRKTPPDEVLAKALLRLEMIPLYMHYINDHIARLTELNRFDLALALVVLR
jgi:hypothetical protein